MKNYEVGSVVNIDFGLENSHCIGLTKRERVIVAKYKNGTILLANKIGETIETTSFGKYLVTCVVSIEDMRSVRSIKTKKVNILENNYKIVAQYMFGKHKI